MIAPVTDARIMVLYCRMSLQTASTAKSCVVPDTMSYVVADCDLARARTQACSIREKKACCSIILCSIGVLELSFVVLE